MRTLEEMRARTEKMFGLANQVAYAIRLFGSSYSKKLEEYFSYNVYDFSNFIKDYQRVPSIFEGIALFMCFFRFSDRDYHNILQSNLDTQRTEYLLADNVDNLFDMKEATTFQMDFRPNEIYRKLSFNYKGFFVEEYRSDVGVKTTIYDIGKVMETAEKCEPEEAKKAMNKEFQHPRFCSKNSEMLTILVVPIIDRTSEICIGYEIKELDSNNQIIHQEKRQSTKSLYSEYYAYMVEKGYFYDGEMKSSGALNRK